MRLVCRSLVFAFGLYVYVSFVFGSVSGCVCSFSVFFVQLWFPLGSWFKLHVLFDAVSSRRCGSVGFIRFLVLLLIAFVFRFRSTPLLADVVLVQAWVGPQVDA